MSSSILAREYAMTVKQWSYLKHRICVRLHEEQRRLERYYQRGVTDNKIIAQSALTATMSALHNKTFDNVSRRGGLVHWRFCPDDSHQVFQLRRTLLDDVRRLRFMKDEEGLVMNQRIQEMFECQYSDAITFFSYV